MAPADAGGMLRPAPEDCSRGAATLTKPRRERASAAAQSPGERIPSSFVRRIWGRSISTIRSDTADDDISWPVVGQSRGGEGEPLAFFSRALSFHRKARREC